MATYLYIKTWTLWNICLTVQSTSQGEDFQLHNADVTSTRPMAREASKLPLGNGQEMNDGSKGSSMGKFRWGDGRGGGWGVFYGYYGLGGWAGWGRGRGGWGPGWGGGWGGYRSALLELQKEARHAARGQSKSGAEHAVNSKYGPGRGFGHYYAYYGMWSGYGGWGGTRRAWRPAWGYRSSLAEQNADHEVDGWWNPGAILDAIGLGASKAESLEQGEDEGKAKDKVKDKITDDEERPDDDDRYDRDRRDDRYDDDRDDRDDALWLWPMFNGMNGMNPWGMMSRWNPWNRWGRGYMPGMQFIRFIKDLVNDDRDDRYDDDDHRDRDRHRDSSLLEAISNYQEFARHGKGRGQRGGSLEESGARSGKGRQASLNDIGSVEDEIDFDGTSLDEDTEDFDAEEDFEQAFGPDASSLLEYVARSGKGRPQDHLYEKSSADVRDLQEGLSGMNGGFGSKGKAKGKTKGGVGFESSMDSKRQIETVVQGDKGTAKGKGKGKPSSLDATRQSEFVMQGDKGKAKGKGKGEKGKAKGF